MEMGIVVKIHVPIQYRPHRQQHRGHPATPSANHREGAPGFPRRGKFLPPFRPVGGTDPEAAHQRLEREPEAVSSDSLDHGDDDGFHRRQISVVPHNPPGPSVARRRDFTDG